MKVGDYVRTKDYGFIKVKSFYYNENMIHILDENCNEYDFSKELVDDFKSSPNIIDLIEEGDYVNGLKVEGVNNEIKGFGTIIFSKDSSIMEDYIYSIVTKEQFENCMYKVGD